MATIEAVDVGAKEAIGMSIRENRIVRIVDATGHAETTLSEECEDSMHSGDEAEFWGSRHDGGEWRVHVVLTTEA